MVFFPMLVYDSKRQIDSIRSINSSVGPIVLLDLQNRISSSTTVAGDSAIQAEGAGSIIFFPHALRAPLSKELAKELMAREPTKEDLPPRKVDTADRPRRPSHSTRSYGKSSATGALLREETRRTKRRLINQARKQSYRQYVNGGEFS